MIGEAWVCWWKDRRGGWWPMTWTIAGRRRDSIEKHDDDGSEWIYARERRRGNVRCVRTTLTAEDLDR